METAVLPVSPTVSLATETSAPELLGATIAMIELESVLPGSEATRWSTSDVLVSGAPEGSLCKRRTATATNSLWRPPLATGF